MTDDELSIDFETRSPVDLKKAGAHANRFILIVRPGVLKTINDIPAGVLKRCLRELA